MGGHGVVGGRCVVGGRGVVGGEENLDEIVLEDALSELAPLTRSLAAELAPPRFGLTQRLSERLSARRR